MEEGTDQGEFVRGEEPVFLSSCFFSFVYLKLFLFLNMTG